MLTAFHCQLDYSGTGVSLGDSADVECRDCTFARLVFGSFGAAAGVTQEVRSKITLNHTHTRIPTCQPSVLDPKVSDQSLT